MRLWLIQDEGFWRDLRERRRVVADWERAPANWWPAYRWMVSAMAARGVDTGGAPPIWAWHSCDGYGMPPNEDTVSSLWGGSAWKGVLITIEPPDDPVVLSRYGYWNDLMDLIGLPFSPETEREHMHWREPVCPEDTLAIDYAAINEEFRRALDEHGPDKKEALVEAAIASVGDRIFDIPDESQKTWPGNCRDIQACLPYVDLDWVVSVEPCEVESWDLTRPPGADDVDDGDV